MPLFTRMLYVFCLPTIWVTSLGLCRHRTVDKEYSSFASRYLPITYVVRIFNKELQIPLPILYYLELIEVTVTDGPVSVLPPPSQNCPKVTDL